MLTSCHTLDEQMDIWCTTSRVNMHEGQKQLKWIRVRLGISSKPNYLARVDATCFAICVPSSGSDVECIRLRAVVSRAVVSRAVYVYVSRVLYALKTFNVIVIASMLNFHELFSFFRPFSVRYSAHADAFRFAAERQKWIHTSLLVLIFDCYGKCRHSEWKFAL